MITTVVDTSKLFQGVIYIGISGSVGYRYVRISQELQTCPMYTQLNLHDFSCQNIGLPRSDPFQIS